MNLSESYFMVVVEEKSISKAAEKLYLSQQNLSNHIKKLENRYGLLFLRKPRFTLTEKGRALYETLQGIRVLENSLQNRLEEIQHDAIGNMRVGIHYTRAKLIMPELLKRLRARYPNIHLTIVLDETATLEKMLLNGEVDLFFGVDITEQREFAVTLLAKERVFLVVPEKMLKKAGLETQTIILKKDLSKLRFSMRNTTGRLQKLLDYYITRNQLKLETDVIVNDFDLQESLAAEGLNAYFMPEIFLKNIEKRNRLLKDGEKLRVFPVEDFTDEILFSLVTHKQSYRFPAMRALMDEAKNIVRERNFFV